MPIASPAAWQDSEARYRLIAENTGDVIWLYDVAANRFAYVSPSVEKLRGYAAAEVYQQTMEDALTSESYRMIRQSLPLRMVALEAGDLSVRTQIHEVEQTRRDGSVVPTEVVTTLLTDAEGKVTQILGVTRDITARRRAQTELKAREEIFASVVDQARDAICVVDGATGRIVEFNAAAHESLGYTREEFARLTVGEFQAEHGPEEIQRNIVRAKRDGSVTFETLHRRRDGELREVRVDIRPLRLQGHDYLSAVWTDITELKRAATVGRIQRDLALALSATTNLLSGLNLCLDAALRVTGLDAGGFYLADPVTGALELVTHQGLGAEFVAATRRFERESPQARRVAEGRAIFTHQREILGRDGPRDHREGLRALAIVPMVCEGSVIGCLNVASHLVDDIPAAGRQALETVAADAAQAIARLRTEESLRTERLRLSNIIEGTRAGTWEWNVQTGETLFNDTWARMIGYELSELQPTTIKTWEAIAHPEDVRRSAELLAQHFAGELPYYECECRLRHRAGHWIWVLDRGCLVSRTAAGDPQTMLGAHTEITERKLAETALRVSERNYRETFNATNDAIYIHDAATARVLDVNDGMLRLFGFASKEEYLASPPDVTFVDESPYQLQDALGWIHRAVAHGPQLFEWKAKTTSGAILWLEVSLRQAEIGGRACILAVVRDIGQRKDAESALRKSEAEFRAILAASDDIILLLEADGRIVRANPTAAARLGYSEPDLVGRIVSDLLPPEVRETRRQQLALAVASQATVRFEDAYGGLHFDNTVYPVRDETTGAVRAAVYARNVTARRQAEAAVRHQTGLINSLLDSIPDLIFFKDLQGVYLACNPAFAEFIGRRREDIVGRTDADLFPPDVAAFFREQDRLMLASGRMRHNEEWVDYPDGRRLLLDTLKTPYTDVHGQILGVLGISRDITERERSQAVLRASEERFRRVVESAPDAVVIHTQGKFAYANPAAVRLFGATSADEVIGQSVIDRIAPDDRAVVAARVRDVIVSGRQQPEMRETCLRLDGSRVEVDVSSVPFVYNDQPGALVFARDMTEAARADAALRLSEARYRSLVENSFDWIWEVDTQGRYTYASPRVRDILGYEPHEVLGKTLFELMPPGEAERVGKFFAELALSRAPIIAFENVNRHRDGRLVVVETNGTASFAPDGTWLGYHGMDRDVTQRRAAEQMLRLRGAALEAAANAIMITNRQGTIEWANSAFTELYGWQRSEVIGRNPREILNSSQHDREFFRQMWTTILAGKVWRGELVNRRKDGALRNEEMTITPLTDERGEIAHFIAIKQDITEQKALEAKGRQMQRMEAIGTLAGGIAHDLNNILTPILMVSDVLKSRVADENDRELLGMLQQGAKRGGDIIKQLLTFSRGLEGKRILVQPRHLIKEMMTIMRETFPREIDLQLDLPPTLARVTADPTQLHQVLLNLCVNARDAMPDGGHLTLRAADVIMAADDPDLPTGARSGPYVLVEVRDTGPGIAPEIKHRIFDPFFTTKPIGKGTGLGLSTAQGIVRSHGGFITVDSQPGRGTIFRVLLPAEQREGAPPAPPEPEKPAAGRGQLILLVDDERGVRESYRLVLERAGYRVLVAVNGEDGLGIFMEHRDEIKMVLTDLMMPAMGGVALIKALRAVDAEIPVVAASGLGEEKNGAELAALGVREVLTKPCEASALLRAVAAQLAGRPNPAS